MNDDKNYVKRIIACIALSVIGLLILNALIMPAPIRWTRAELLR